MTKALGLAAILAAAFTASAPAALHPLDTANTEHPSGPLSFRLSPAPVAVAEPPMKLDLRMPVGAAPSTDFIVGKNTLLLAASPTHGNWHSRPAFDHRDEWDLVEHQVAGPDVLDTLAKMFDVEESERPWSTTTTVHVLAPTDGWLKPFASVAHEVDVNEDLERMGIGGGAMIMLGKHTSINAELLYFAGDRTPTNDSFGTETRFLTRLQIDF